MNLNYKEIVALPDLDSISERGKEWLSEVMPEFSISGLVEDIISGKSFVNPNGIANTVMRIFANEIYEAVKILALIVAIALLGAVLENLRSAFGKEGFNAGAISYIGVICGLGVKLFRDMSVFAESASGDMTFIMASLLPALVTLTAGGGNVLAGSMTHPILLLMCNVFANIFDKILIPLSISYMAVSMIDIFGAEVKLSKLKDLIKKVYNFIIGIVMTFFIGILGISGFAAVSLDGLGAKGARFAVSNMVPFVGSSISDAMSAVASACMLIKNAVGVAGLVAVAAIGAIPIIKIGTVVLAMRICTAVCEPIADERGIGALSAIGDSLSMINAALISTAVMMVIAISVIIGVRPL